MSTKTNVEYIRMRKDLVLRLEELIITGANDEEIALEIFKVSKVGERALSKWINAVLGIQRCELIDQEKYRRYLEYKDHKLSILEMAKLENIDISSMQKRIDRFDNEDRKSLFEDYLKFRSEREKMWETQVTTLVTKDYYKPIFLEFYFIVNYDPLPQKFVYVPEKDVWIAKKSLKRYLKKNSIDYLKWECRWYLDLDEEFIGTYTWAKKKVERFFGEYSSNFKEYSIDRLISNPELEITYSKVKKDVIDGYFKSRELNHLPYHNIDFSLVPDELLVNTKFKIIYKDEINDISGELYDLEYITTYNNFIMRSADSPVIRNIDIQRSTREKRWKDILINLKSIHGDKYDFTNSKYVRRDVPIEVKCNSCGTIFYATTDSLLGRINREPSKYCCPNCLKIHMSEVRRLSESEVLTRLNNLYRDLPYDFSEMVYINDNTPVKIINTDTGEIFYRKPEYLFQGKLIPKIYKGEFFVENWLMNNNLAYDIQVRHKNEIFTSRLTNTVIVDFQLLYENQLVIIEYNGVQHYKYIPSLFHKDKSKYENQLLRDRELKLYCEQQSIKLIEVPYIINTKQDIFKFLDEVLINKTDPEKLIDYNKLFK